jgi:hypothetical protein
LVVPGVTGMADDEYIKELVSLANAQGFDAAVLHPIGPLEESSGKEYSMIYTPQHFDEIINLVRK